MTGFPLVIPERDCAPPLNSYLGVAPDVSSHPDSHPLPWEGGGLRPALREFPPLAPISLTLCSSWSL